MPGCDEGSGDRLPVTYDETCFGIGTGSRAGAILNFKSRMSWPISGAVSENGVRTGLGEETFTAHRLDDLHLRARQFYKLSRQCSGV